MKTKLLLVAGTVLITLLGSGCGEPPTGPTADAPLVKESASTTKPSAGGNQYNWSTMNQGPYKDKVSFATASSPIGPWTDGQTILAEHASVPDVVQLNDGTVIAYFVYVPEDGYPERVGYMKSTDNGETWSKADFVSIDGLGDKAPADPTPVLLSDGQVRLFYFDIGESRHPTGSGPSKNKIYSAVSSDGVNFVEEDGVRFAYDGIFDPSVIHNGDGSWRMYVGNQDGQKVLSATSSDGLSFIYEGVAYSGGAIPDAIYDEGKYYLYVAGIDIATSGDGKTFTKTNSRFSGASGPANDPGVIKLQNGSFLMVYKTSDSQPQAQNQPQLPR